MKTIKNLAAALLLASALPAMAWDGIVTGVISKTEVGDSGLNLIVYLSGVATACTGGPAWVYLNEADALYKTFLSNLLLAKTTGIPVTLHSTKVGAYCHLGYLVFGS